jgi:peptide/nickel transport system ATP-binding protein
MERRPHELSGGQRQRIAIMREGEIVELADARELWTNPQHEYTKDLLRSFPRLTGERGVVTR